MASYKNLNIAILDYGFGNTGSLKNFVTKIGFFPEITSSKSGILNSDLLIIPGVGSAVGFFKSSNRKICQLIKLRAKKKLPIIGICLGAQVLFEYLEESNKSGLSILKGKVRKLNYFNNNWRVVDFKKKNNHFFKKKNNSFYFNHEYYLDPKKKYETYNIKGETIPAVLIHKNIVCFQFHPEKSQNTGFEVFKKTIDYFYEKKI
tara:strand:+ start:149 stop:760 length:612 start_codon:yes stop_codon:yes gene_type:complete